MTTYEALKANETKRVRVVGTVGWWEPLSMIAALNAGDFEITRPVTWEAEEPLIERWAVITPLGDIRHYYSTLKLAQEQIRIHERIVHLREVRS